MILPTTDYSKTYCSKILHLTKAGKRGDETK